MVRFLSDCNEELVLKVGSLEIFSSWCSHDSDYRVGNSPHLNTSIWGGGGVGRVCIYILMNFQINLDKLAF